MDLRAPPVSDYNEALTVLFSHRPGDFNNNDGAMCSNARVYIDFGDVPDTYGTTFAADGPRHFMRHYDPVNHTNDLMLGSKVMAESDGQPGILADSDDSKLGGEDGVVSFTSPAGGSPTEINATVNVTNDTGKTVYVYGWRDTWNSSGVPDGTFDPAERISFTVPAGTNLATLVFKWSGSGLPRVSGHTYLRFRVCSDQNECGIPTGPANDGEVEGYRADFDFSPTAVTIGKVELQALPAAAFLAGVGVEQMDDAVLLALLEAWDSAAAASLAGADRDTIISALNQYLDPDGDGQVAVLAWDTLEERGTIGFYVDRREAGDDVEWVRINNDMLPGLITAPMGGEYQLADPEARSGKAYEYQLIEQEARGTTRSYGPFKLQMN